MKTKSLILFLVFLFLPLCQAIEAQQVLSERSFQSSRFLHSNDAIGSSAKGITTIGAVSPMQQSAGWTGGGCVQFGHSGSRNASVIQSAGSVVMPVAVRRDNGWEGGDDDDDDNWTQTGGTGDGQGNAGDPMKDPIPVGDALPLFVLGCLYAALSVLKRRNRQKEVKAE